MNTFIIVLLIFYLNTNFTNSFYVSNNHPNVTLNNFTFGSCFYGRESTRLDIFEKIAKENSQMFIWAGDSAYVDTQTIMYYWKSTIETNLTLAKEIFKESKNEKCKIIFYYRLF
jgi:hypothetical protein